VLQRQLKKDPIAQGGWSAGVGNWQGIDWLNPAGNSNLRGDSKAPGWYKSEKMGALRSRWLAAANLADQQRICREIQALSFEEIPYFPIGQYKQPTAYRSSITGILDGTAVFWNVKPA
jgi:peptide/nickel transport system substrate-binding protein